MNNDQDRIDAYLKGRLSAAEAKAFEQELAENQELAQELAIRRFESDVMEKLAKDDLMAYLQTLQHDADAQREVKMKKIRRLAFRLAAAAVAGIILTFGWVVYHASSRYSNEAIAATFDHTFIADAPQSKGGAPVPSSPADPRYMSILENRIREQAPLAISYFDSLVSAPAIRADSLWYPELQFYRAYAHFLNKSYPKAASLLTALKDSNPGDPHLAEKTAFYLSLAILANNDVPTARRLLEQLRQSGNYFEDAADEVLQALDSSWRRFSIF